VTDMPTKVLGSAPSLAALYAKAVVTAVPLRRLIPGLPARRGEQLTGVGLQLSGVAPEQDRVRRYREVCGFRPGQVLPPTYPHLLAFPLQLALMTDPSFPFPPMGVVHIGNRITQMRQLGLGEPLDLTVTATDMRPHWRGTQLTLVSQAAVAGTLVWREETMLLHRGPSNPSAVEQTPDLPRKAPAGPVRWELPGDLGRRYAALSGDRNPIHLYDVTARPFGFRRHIAHGMWVKARALAAVENRLPQGFTVEVAFRRPVTLPSTVTFGVRAGDRRIDLGLTSADGTQTHLLGRITATD
jgi:acyl dehydratase